MRILITAGPTREPIDLVRFLSNRSSGRMGYALAEAAQARGHEVVLISGPVCLDPPDGVILVGVETAEEMFDAVAREIPGCDGAIFCAAVSDYRVAEVVDGKIKKSGEPLTLALVENRDILGSAREQFHFSGVLVGFAAETEGLEENALVKLERKGCDLVVGNDVGRDDIGFDRDENEVILFFQHGDSRHLPRASKIEIAREILAVVEDLARGKDE